MKGADQPGLLPECRLSLAREWERRSLAWIAAMIWAAILVVSVPGCGASIQAVYEGDVRFEHCMALDARTDVKSQIRQRCWIEWVAFYTYGQTRDRVIHAQLRIKQLSGLSDFVQAPDGPLSTPPPTSETASPPESPSSTAGSCVGECKALRKDCGRDCNTTSCRKTCSTSFISCMDACG